MKMWRLAPQLAFGGLLVGSLTGAYAGTLVQATNEVQLNGLTITVVDLDLTDGIDAGFRFVSTPLLKSSRVVAYNKFGKDDYLAKASNRNFGSAAISPTFDTPGVTGSVHAEVVAGGGRLALPASIGVGQSLAFEAITRTPGNYFAWAQISTQDRRDYAGTAARFVVTPNTRVTFSASFAASASTDVDNSVRDWRSAQFDAYAGATMVLSGGLYDHSGKVGSVFADDRAGFWLSALAHCERLTPHLSRCSDTSQSMEEMLAATIETGKGQQFEGTLLAATHSVIMPHVPEPGSLAMMLAGLVALVLVGSRRYVGAPIVWQG